MEEELVNAFIKIIIGLGSALTLVTGGLVWALKSALNLIGNHLEHLRKTLEEMDDHERERHDKFLEVYRLTSDTCQQTAQMWLNMVTKKE